IERDRCSALLYRDVDGGTWYRLSSEYGYRPAIQYQWRTTNRHYGALHDQCIRYASAGTCCTTTAGSLIFRGQSRTYVGCGAVLATARHPISGRVRCLP